MQPEFLMLEYSVQFLLNCYTNLTNICINLEDFLKILFLARKCSPVFYDQLSGGGMLCCRTTLLWGNMFFARLPIFLEEIEEGILRIRGLSIEVYGAIEQVMNRFNIDPVTCYECLLGTIDYFSMFCKIGKKIVMTLLDFII